MTCKTDTLRLKKVMIEKGFGTISKLSEEANICNNTLGQIIKGKIYPSSAAMLKLVETLSLTPVEAGEIFFSPILHNTQNTG